MRKERNKPKTLLQKIGNVFASVIFIFAILLLIFTSYTVIQSKNDPKNAFVLGYKPVIVETGSMSPYISQDSMVIIHKTDFTQVKPGDVVTYEMDGQFITHRAISVGGGQIIVKGDANAIADPMPVTPQSFVGTAAYRMNWTQPIISGFKTNPLSAAIRYIGFPLLAIILIWFIVHMVRKFLQTGKHDKEELI